MQKKLLLIDHYDSFTYNLVQYFQELGVEVLVKKCDKVVISDIESLSPDYLVFSPGPGSVYKSEDIGNSEAVIKHFMGKIPILGVCLGHQLIGKIMGAEVITVEPRHGKRDSIKITSKSGLLLHNLPGTFSVMRYHSQVIKSPSDKGGLEGLIVTAASNDGLDQIMALEVPGKHCYGVQFHPESIGTPHGMQILENFLQSSQ